MEEEKLSSPSQESSIEDTSETYDLEFKKLTGQITKASYSIPRELPILTEQPAQYKPLPYTFRIPSNTYGAKSTAKCPPFYVQLDHTLAVVWSLFSTEPTERPLGVVQLQWALSFLKGLRNQRGKHPEDIVVCIEAMEEALIEQYAEMADSVLPASCNTTVGKPHKKDELPSTTEFDEKKGKRDKERLAMKKLPFSVTYAEMSKCQPNHLQQLFQTPRGISMADVDIQREVEKLKVVVGEEASEGHLKDTASKENMVEFLKVFRKEQIGKIQEELKRLHSIETFIGNIDKDNFEPYLNNQQLDILIARKAPTPEQSSKTVEDPPPAADPS